MIQQLNTDGMPLRVLLPPNLGADRAEVRVFRVFYEGPESASVALVAPASSDLVWPTGLGEGDRNAIKGYRDMQR
ncbi:hypothetical protein SAMN05216325_101186 [Nitrosomonas marina]|uniref:Uncharacterized protein n=2 Tax=Nitrosomonas marina TaxID=917 RepID=A0A1H8AJH6_9PROT|nr:hypothetical protein SAMN05216325_101186 [Nitrosomonas marina]